MVANPESIGLPQGQSVRTLQLGEDQVSVEDAELLFRGDYSREGGDLVISYGGRSFVITEYFDAVNPPDLVTTNGAVFTPGTVSSLAGPMSPGQYAQADGGGDLIEIGTVQTLNGIAYSTQGNGIKTELAEGDPVYQGDLIETGPDSKLGIGFVDKTVFSISANARMVLDELIFDPNESDNNSMVFNLIEGGFVFLTGEIAPSGNMEMKTPGGTMGIRGTMPVVNIDGDSGTEEYSVSVEIDGTSGSYILTVGDKTFVVEDTGEKWLVSGGDVTVIGKQGLDYLLEEEEREFIDVVLNAINDRSELEGGPTYNRIDFETPSGTVVNIDAGPPADDGFTFTSVGPDTNGADKDDPPVTFPDSYTIHEDTDLTGANVISGSGAGADYDPDGYTIRVVEVNGQPLTFINGVATVQLPPSADVVAGSGGTTGAVLLITEDGNITYQVGSVYQYLAIDESAIDSFTYTVRDKNGFTTTETVTVTIEGNNDSPDIIIDTGAGDSAAEPLTEANDPLTVSGTLSVADVDITDFVDAKISSVTINPASTGPASGHPSNDVLKSMMTLEQSEIIDGDFTTGKIVWTFDSDVDSDPGLEAFDYLAAGETLILDYVVFQALDDSGSDGSGNDEVPLAEQIVTITITGTNDQPEISYASASDISATLADVAEVDQQTVQPDLHAEGTLSFADVDLTDRPVATEANPLISATAEPVVDGGPGGALTLSQAQYDAINNAFTITNTPGNTNDGTVTWDYTLAENAVDFLGEGETVTAVFTITVTDGSGFSSASGNNEQDSDTQTVTITINGANDTPVIVAASTEDAGAVTELADGATSPDELTSDLTDMGTITFADVDLTDTHMASVTGRSVTEGASLLPTGVTELGTLSLDPVNDSTDTVKWTFTVNDGAVDFLAEGESIEQEFIVTIDDGNTINPTVTQVVTITINGTNDTPVIVAASTEDAGAVTELADGATSPDELTSDLTDMGTITFADVDLTDTHMASVTGRSVTEGASLLPTGVTELGTLSLDPVNDSTDTVKWTFTVNDGAVDFLAEGESIEQEFIVTIDDGNTINPTVTQVVTITINGTNDAPTVESDAVEHAGEVTELADGATSPDELTSDLTDMGTITFADVDLTDTHMASVTGRSVTEGASLLPTGVTELGTLSLDPVNDSTDTVKWTFTVNDGAVDFLAEGESIEQEFIVTIDDGNTINPTVTQVVTITINGANDAPTVESDAVEHAGEVTELADGATSPDELTSDLTDMGTITFADVDLTDTHMASVTGRSVTEGASLLPTGVTELGTLSLDPVNDSTDTVKWTFTVNDGAVDFLAEGESIEQEFIVTIDDGNTINPTVTQVVTITINGANDTPTVLLSATVPVTEDTSPLNVSFEELDDTPKQSLDTSGTVEFDDVDANDTVTLSYELVDEVMLTRSGQESELKDTMPVRAGKIENGFSVTPTEVTETEGLAAPGSADWSFDVDKILLDFLAEGDKITFSFAVTATDNNGGVETEIVEFTIEGTNDAPIMGIPVGLSVNAGNVSGNLVATDVDGDDLIFGLVEGSDPEHGTAVVESDGSFSYSPDEVREPDSFQVYVSDRDGEEALVDTATVILGDADGSLLEGDGGTDFIFGFEGDDELRGMAGNDLLAGNRGMDILKGGQGDDTLKGGRGSDTLEGGRGNDILLGGRGGDTLEGGRGSDILEGGLGIDSLQGDEGKDFFVLTDLTNFDNILDYTEGEDVIDLDALLAGATDASTVTAVENDAEGYTSLRVSGTEVARLTDVSAGEELSIVYNSAEAAAQVTVAAAMT